MSINDNNLNQSFYEKIDEENVTLSKELIVKNLSQLGKTADGTKVAYLNLKLSDHDLTCINSLSKFNEIQTLDLSNNQLKDLSVLSELPYLLNLDVSHNKIEKLFDFLPPYNLKEANFSHNIIKEIGNLSNFHYLQSLDLNTNNISKIEGLEYCQRLRNLNLSNNQIKKIEGLENLPLINLDLRNNQIRKIEGLETLKFLCSLALSNNYIKSLEGIPDKHEFLEFISLENNKISNLKDIEYLVDLNLLRDLNLTHNPITEAENYRLSAIFKLPKLSILDRSKIDPTDKVNAKNLFHPSAEYIASRDHMTNFIFNIIQDHQVRESTLPSIDSPYPILILSGPEGSGAAEIARKLADEYPSYFDFVATHSTRKPRPLEKDKMNYNFINMQEFEQDVTQGKFICCNEHFGNWYGIQWNSIESVARQGLACVTHMELESLLSFKQTYFEPRCVLIITLDKVAQIQRLIGQGCSEPECEIAINRTEWYAEYNRDHPGFFDAVIITDDISEGYENLRNLVLNYLGVADQQQQELVKESQAKQIMMIQHELTNLKQNRPKSNDRKRFEELYNKEMKELELPRSDSFLPSNTMTGNRSQMSHLSIESLSQLYNTSLRMKFGSAPAQLLTQGEQAEKSLEKRASAIKKELVLNNLITAQSQLTNQISKQAMQGTLSSNSWVKSERNTKSRDATITNLDTNHIYSTATTNKQTKTNSHYQNSVSNKLKSSDKNKFDKFFDDSSEDEDRFDDDYIDVVTKLKSNHNKDDRASSISQESARLSNLSTPNSID